MDELDHLNERIELAEWELDEWGEKIKYNKKVITECKRQKKILTGGIE